MLRSRRGKPVYLVYDEDAFLASPNGGLAAAPSAGSPRSGRPHVYRGRWTLALAVTLAAATTAHLVASRLNHEEGSPSGRTDGHARDCTRPLCSRGNPSSRSALCAIRRTAVRLASRPRSSSQEASSPGATCPSGWRAPPPEAAGRIIRPTAGTGTGGAALLTDPSTRARGDPPWATGDRCRTRIRLRGVKYVAARISVSSRSMRRLRVSAGLTRWVLYATAIAGLAATARFAIAPPHAPAGSASSGGAP